MSTSHAGAETGNPPGAQLHLGRLPVGRNVPWQVRRHRLMHNMAIDILERRLGNEWQSLVTSEQYEAALYEAETILLPADVVAQARAFFRRADVSWYESERLALREIRRPMPPMVWATIGSRASHGASRAPRCQSRRRPSRSASKDGPSEPGGDPEPSTRRLPGAWSEVRGSTAHELSARVVAFVRRRWSRPRRRWWTGLREEVSS